MIALRLQPLYLVLARSSLLPSPSFFFFSQIFNFFSSVFMILFPSSLFFFGALFLSPYSFYFAQQLPLSSGCHSHCYDDYHHLPLRPSIIIMITTTQDPFGVMMGGFIGHAMCTTLAVIGGRLVAQRISVRTGRHSLSLVVMVVVLLSSSLTLNMIL